MRVTPQEHRQLARKVAAALAAGVPRKTAKRRPSIRCLRCGSLYGNLRYLFLEDQWDHFAECP